MNDFIINSQWNVPTQLQNMFRTLLSHIQLITIPWEQKQDHLLWKHTKSILHTCRHSKFLVKTDLEPINSPAKSFTVWRLIHRKMPTDDNLIKRSCNMPSMCSLCYKQQESVDHLFLHCNLASSIWYWFQSILNIPINLNSALSIFEICQRNWSPQCKLVICSAVVNIFNIIWLARNNSMFNNIKPNLNFLITLISANVNLVGNLTKEVTGSAIDDFNILKDIKFNTHHPNAPKIIEVLWQPPGNSAFGGLFRNSSGQCKGCFAFNLGISDALNSEIMRVIIAIKIAYEKKWNKLWIESDSKLATLALKSSHIIPAKLTNRWNNCIMLLNSMEFFVSHIYREGNHGANKLANLGLSLPIFTWWSSPPIVIREDLVKNKLGLPYYRNLALRVRSSLPSFFIKALLRVLKKTKVYPQ